MTQDDLAAVAEVSKPLIMRVEQGLISNVSISILDALYGVGESRLQAKALDAFDEWRKETRAKNIVYFLNRLERSDEFRGSWLSFRESICSSQVGFCKLYCIHPQVLRNFEKPKLVSKRRELSAYLKDVFSSAGIENIERLESGMRYYADTHSERLVV